jgi:hypothetical protein
MPPAGFKRSRAIWDETRRTHATTLETVRAWMSAIAYEIQPVRLSESNRRRVGRSVQNSIGTLISLLRSLPGVCMSLLSFLGRITRRQWLIAGASFGYYLLVRWIHEYVLEVVALFVCCLCSCSWRGRGTCHECPSRQSGLSHINSL